MTALPLILAVFLFLASFLSFVALQLPQAYDDPGLGWHLMSGVEMLREKRILREDPFLFISTGRPWISDQWASDLLFSLLFRWGGFPLLGVLLVALFCSTFLIFLPSLLQKERNSLFLSYCGGLFAFKCAEIHSIVRPVILSFPLFLGTLWACGMLAVERKPLSKKVWILLPLVFFCWANLHPSFVLGIGVLALRTLTALYRKEKVLSWLSLLALSFAVTIINPFGLSLHRSILFLGQNAYFMKLHEEWQPLSLLSFEGGLYGAGLFLLCWLWKVKGRFFSLEQGLVALCFTLLPFSAIRFLPYAGLVLAPLIAQTSLLFFQQGQKSRFPVLSSFFQYKEKSFKLALFLGTALIGWILLSINQGEPIGADVSLLRPSKEKFPYAEVSFLNAVAEKKVGVLAPPEWGGFITFMSQGQLRPLIDDRNTLIGEQFYREFFDTLTPRGKWREYACNSGVRFLLLPTKGKLVRTVNEQGGFSFQYRGPLATLYKVEESSCR